MSSVMCKWFIRTYLFIALCAVALPGWAASSNYAMQMDKADTSLLLDITAAGSRLVAVGERGHILYSDNKGDSWTQAVVPTSAMLTRVFFLTADIGWVVGHDGNILASYDGGINWELQRDGVTEQARINESRAGRAKTQLAALREALTSTDSQNRGSVLLELEDAESALARAQNDLDEAVFAPPLMDVWFANEQQGWASGAYGTLLHTSNGGRQWQDWSHKVNNEDQLHLNGVTGTASGTLLLASEWGTIFYSSTAGESWKARDSGYEGSFFGLVVNPKTNSIFSYGLRGTIYRSTDNGMNWAEVTSKVQDSLFGAYASPEGHLTFVGANGTVTQSKDNGETFTRLTPGSRLGVYGIAPVAGGNYMLSGEKGSRPLNENTSSERPE